MPKEPSDRRKKKELKGLDPHTEEKRRELEEKQKARREAHLKAGESSKTWASQVVAEDAVVETQKKKQSGAWKKAEQERKREIAEMRKRKEEQAEHEKALKEERDKEQKEKQEYMKSLGEQNRRMMREDRRKTESEQTLERLKIEAERDAHRKKLEAEQEERREAHRISKQAQKRRGDADIHEELLLKQIRDAAELHTAKLNAQENSEVAGLESDLRREKSIIEALRRENPALAQAKEESVRRDEDRRRKDIRAKYEKKRSDVQVDANKKISASQAQVKRERDEATMLERKSVADAEAAMHAVKWQAEKDEIEKKREASETAKKIERGETDS